MSDEQTAPRPRPENSSRRREGEEPVRLTAEEARQGRIILSTPARRAIFVAGLAGIVALAVISGLMR